MRLIGLTTNKDDDADFISLTQRLIHGIVSTRRLDDYCVVRIDNWFGDRWLNFSGKTLGALGVHKPTRVTFPPLVPSRVRSYTLSRFDATEDDYCAVEEGQPVHKWQSSGTNLQNFVESAFPESSFFWFSGNSGANRRGSVMGYVSGNGECWTWYLEFRKDTEWKQSKGINIAPDEVRFYLDKCLGHSKGPCPTKQLALGTAPRK